MKQRWQAVELRVPLLYALFGGLWILFSDALLAAMVQDSAVLTTIQTGKGWAFVVISAALIGLLLRRYSHEAMRAATALQESEERYRQLFENSADAILLAAPDGTVYAANPAACQIFGRSEEEICRVGRDGLVDRNDPRLRLALEERARTGRFRGELNCLRADGTPFTAELASALFHDHTGQARTTLSFRDLSERRRLERDIALTHSRLAHVLDNITDAFITLDRNWRITYVNTEAARINQKRPEEFLGKSHWEEWPAAIGTRVEQEYRRVMEERVAAHFEHHYLIDGTYDVWLDIRAYPIDGGIALYYNDISERKRAEAALQATNDQLNALTVRLTEVEERERAALARELHDRVGQTLTALNINLMLIQNTLSDEALLAVGSRLDDATGLVDETVECVRDVMANLYPPVLADYGLVAALRWYADRFTRRTGLAVQLELAADDERLAFHLEAVLFRVVQEAMHNVARHAQASQIVLAFDQGTSTRLRISDNGCGFDATAPIVTHERGGWGVRTMRERVEAVGGQFRLESAPGYGTMIVVIIDA
ncbi:MAG: PAS domain-containing sensor histidine kinase [Oscillochloridaceae bacterium umkhey_bin13]